MILIPLLVLGKNNNKANSKSTVAVKSTYKNASLASQHMDSNLSPLCCNLPQDEFVSDTGQDCVSVHKTSVVPQSRRNVHKNATVSHELSIPLNNRFELLGVHQDEPALHPESVGPGFESIFLLIIQPQYVVKQSHPRKIQFSKSYHKFESIQPVLVCYLSKV